MENSARQEMTVPEGDAAPMSTEARVLCAVQRGLAAPPVVAAARGLSLFGEHAGGWLAAGMVGALVDRRRRREWLTATAGVAAEADVAEYAQAHAADLDLAGVAAADRLRVARERLQAERRRELISDWLAELRKRTPVVEIKD